MYFGENGTSCQKEICHSWMLLHLLCLYRCQYCRITLSKWMILSDPLVNVSNVTKRFFKAFSAKNICTEIQIQFFYV